MRKNLLGSRVGICRSESLGLSRRARNPALSSLRVAETVPGCGLLTRGAFPLGAAARPVRSGFAPQVGRSGTGHGRREGTKCGPRGPPLGRCCRPRTDVHSAASTRPSGLFKSGLKYLCSRCSRHRFLVKSPYSLLRAGGVALGSDCANPVRPGVRLCSGSTTPVCAMTLRGVRSRHLLCSHPQGQHFASHSCPCPASFPR